MKHKVNFNTPNVEDYVAEYSKVRDAMNSERTVVRAVNTKFRAYVSIVHALMDRAIRNVGFIDLAN